VLDRRAVQAVGREGARQRGGVQGSTRTGHERES
jgi:hypothetical protein